MANKSRQSVDLGQTFKAGLPQAGAGLASAGNANAGMADSSLFSVSNALADQVGRFADELAGAEGARAGAIAGDQANFEPGRVDTLRGRAFDRAGTDAYLSKLTAQFTSDSMDLYEAHKNDPAGFKAAYEGKVKEYEGAHVFPEAQAHFRAKATSIASSLRARVLSNFEGEQNDRRRASFVEDEGRAVSNQQRLLAAAPDDPNTERAVRDEADARKLRVDGLAATGALSAEQAAKRKLAIDDESSASLILARAGTRQTPDELAAYREQFRADFQAGKIKGLVDYDAVDAQLAKMQQQRGVQIDKNLRALDGDLAAFVDREKDGWSPGSSEWLALQSRGRALGEEGGRRVAIAEMKLKLGRDVAALPLDQAEARQARIEQAVREKGGDPVSVEAAKYSRSVLEARRTAMGQDPVGAGEREYGATAGVVNFTGEPDALAGELASRIPAAMSIAQASGRKVTYLRPEEKARAQAVLDEGGDKALALIDGVIRGGKGQAPAILAEIGDGAPALAHAGLVMASTGDREFARQVSSLRKAEKAAPGGRLPGPSETALGEVQRAVYGRALSSFEPAELASTRAAASAWARVEFARRNIDPKDGDETTKAVLTEAFQRARGRTTSNGIAYGGLAETVTARGFFFDDKAPVQIPPNVRADKFSDLMSALTTADLAGLKNPPVTKSGEVLDARRLRAAELQAVPGGYAFGHTDKGNGAFTPLRGRDGKIFVLPWAEVEPALRGRVPAAFR